MCKEAKKKIQKIKLPKSTQEGLDVVLDEIGKTNKKIDSVVAKQDEQAARIETLETATAEILGLVRPIYERVIVDKIDEQAAQLGLIKKVFTTKVGWVAMGIGVLGLIAIGIAGVYFIEHAGSVAQIVDAVK